ncbi:MAG: RNA ligase family protein [Blastocatellia bacterium]|nr:RNA ligase family protein [Blastocatellia bacterium]MBL8194191.1 RNA ligase family protein [Blastocatellia bacterium]
MQIYKYPRTPHLEGSRFQPGDEDLDCLPFSEIADNYVVIEEKLDGANSAISFNENGQLMLQSRGHFLLGGNSERHFNLLKQWANCHTSMLWNLLGLRYIMYGEWLYAKHTMFYNALPHYFIEFDILDLEENCFLSTEYRQQMLKDLPIVSAPVLFSGKIKTLKDLQKLLITSNFITPNHLEILKEICQEQNLSVERAIKETDHNRNMEGLYIKVEENGKVKARFKYVRASFLTAVEASESHWQSRPIIPNLLANGINLFTTGNPLC